MKRHEFYTATGIVDKFFNTSEPEMADGRLTIDEHQGLCAQAQTAVRKVFPKYANRISVTPARDPREEFAGYTLSYEDGPNSFGETLEFDFGSEGIDVV